MGPARARAGASAAWGAAAALAGAGWCAGCAAAERPRASPGPRPDWSTRASERAFAPAAMRLSGLTRLTRGEDGRGVIVLHLELLDAWGDGVKAPGNLQVRLYRPAGSAVEGGLDVQEVRWDVAMTDPEVNSSLYDPATRTYRVALGRLPAWVEELADAPARGDEEEAARTYIRLRAVFETVGADGQGLYLQDELVIRR